MGKGYDHRKHSPRSLRSAMGSQNHQKRSLTFFLEVNFLFFFLGEKLERYKRNEG